MLFYKRLAAVCLIMTAPLWGILAWKWPISTDFIFYATIGKSFSAQIWSGELYPRWLIDTNAGFGSPVFLFYSPASFYLMSLFDFLSPIDPHGFGRLVISITLALAVAGITSCRWLKTQTNAGMAEKGALLYAGFPYLALHIYGGFAAPQLWGIALFPLLLETAQLMAKTGWRAIAPLSLAYAALCFTHLPSLVIFGAIPCLYVAVFAPNAKRLSYSIAAVFAAALGICLAAIYILPAIMNKPYIASEHFLDGNLVYANDFLDTWSLLAIISVILPLAGLYTELPKTIRRASLTLPVRFWLAVLACLLFLALPLSKPLWDVLPPLQHVQFPFRFFLAMLPGAVFIAIHWLPYARSRRIYQIMFAVGLVCAAVYSAEIAFFAKKAPVASILDNNLLARPEYQTRWMEAENIDFRTHVPEDYKQMQPITFIKGNGTGSVLAQDSRTMTFRTNVSSPEATILLRRFYFPGWQVAAGLLNAGEDKALLSLQLPQGKHDITLSLPWFAGEREGMVISLAALMVLLCFGAFSRLHRSHNRPITNPDYQSLIPEFI